MIPDRKTTSILDLLIAWSYIQTSETIPVLAESSKEVTLMNSSEAVGQNGVSSAAIASLIAAKGVNHIGIAVRSLDAQRAFYEGVLGARFESIEEVRSQKVRVAFYALGPKENPTRLELLEPTSPDSPVAQFIEKRGEGLHHVAYTVSDIAGRLSALHQAGVRLIDEYPRAGAHGSQIAFVHPKSSGGVLTELCEPRRSNPGAGHAA